MQLTVDGFAIDKMAAEVKVSVIYYSDAPLKCKNLLPDLCIFTFTFSNINVFIIWYTIQRHGYVSR